MSIAAEIDATVAAFVADLAAFVRRVAEETLQEALGELEPPLPTDRRARTPSRPHPARSPKAVPGTAVSAKPVAASPPTPPEPPVAIRRILPKRRRVAKAAPPLPIERRTSEPVPAKNWVVVRRPARARPEATPGFEPHAQAPGAVPDALGLPAATSPRTAR